MSDRPDSFDRARALKVRACIARGASIHQHGNGVITMRVDGEPSMLVTNEEEMRRVIPGWPRKDEAQVIGGGRG